MNNRKRNFNRFHFIASGKKMPKLIEIDNKLVSFQTKIQ